MQPEESNAAPSAEQRTRATTILIIEDDEDLREVIGLLMSTIPAYHYYLVPDAMTATRLEALRPEIEQRQITAFEKPFDLDAFVLTVQRMIGKPRSETRADEGHS
jgi:hypothetical protein